MATCVMVHGFADNDGHHTLDRLRPYLESAGLDVVDFDYGFTGLLGVRFLNGKRAKKLAALAGSDLSKPLIGIGHSNGCALLRRASLLGAPFSKLILIAPALDRKADIGAQVKRIHVLHSKYDSALWFARLFAWHEWGDMGRVGYKGDDARFINHDKLKDYGEGGSWGHLDMFRKLEKFGPIIAQIATENDF